MRSRRPFSDLRGDAAATLFNRGFAGYLTPLTTTGPALERMVAVESIDTSASWVVVASGQDVGLGLVARRGALSRIATMAIVAESRGHGHGRWLVERLVDDARARRDDSLRLECIEQNEPALELYRSAGFETTRRLLGYRATSRDVLASEAARPATGEALEPIDVETLGRAMSNPGAGVPLPWQLDATRVLGTQGPASAVRLGSAMALFNRRGTDHHLMTLWVKPDARRRGAASRLLARLAHESPDARWLVPPLVPEGHMDHFFAARGFQTQELSQVEMVLDLAA